MLLIQKKVGLGIPGTWLGVGNFIHFPTLIMSTDRVGGRLIIGTHHEEPSPTPPTVRVTYSDPTHRLVATPQPGHKELHSDT